MSSTYIYSEMLPIARFLSNASLIKVPPFQRSYAWTDEEVKQLWVDIAEAMDTQQKEYFLGPMVVKTTGENYEIIDGQQRIATVYIILSIIRRMFRNNGDDKRADWYRNKYFGEQDVHTLETVPKFHMNEENNPSFLSYVQADTTEELLKQGMKDKLKKDSDYLLLQAITIMWESIQQRQKELANSNFDIETLLAIPSYLQESVYVLLLKVQDEADAYVIFETLNDRGKGLNTMDLLKNHVFGRAGNYLEQVKANWTSIRSNLADIDPSERFLYHYWTSLHGRTSKNKLFRLMRGEIKGAQASLSFANKLTNASKLYAALNIPGHPHWNSYPQQARDNLEALNLLDAQQALPILLAAADTFTEEEFGKLTKVLVVMAVRYNLIGELRTGVAANYYSDIPPKIRAGKLPKSAKVFRELKSIYPSDEEFKAAFASKVLPNAPKARYLLSQMEKYLHDGKSEVVNDPKQVNLEHILPKNPSQEWNKALGSSTSEDIDDYVHRIGNLALVSTNINKKVGSKGFEVKKSELFAKEEHFELTKMIAEYPQWTPKEIMERQNRLADVAVKVWKIDSD